MLIMMQQKDLLNCRKSYKRLTYIKTLLENKRKSLQNWKHC